MQTVSRNRWVLGGVTLAISAMLFAAAPYFQQVAHIGYVTVIADVLLVIAFILFVRDAGERGAMLRDRTLAWTSVVLLIVAIVGRAVTNQIGAIESMATAPNFAATTAATYLFHAAGLIALGTFAWAVSRSVHVHCTYRLIIVITVTAIIAAHVVMQVMMATPVLATPFVLSLFGVLSAVTWALQAFGMLAIALAAILAVHHDDSRWHDPTGAELPAASAEDVAFP